MAKSEYRVHGRFDELVREVEGGIGAGSESDEELMDACKEFEAYFVEKIFDTMLESTKMFSDDKDENSYGNKMVDVFKETALHQLSSQVADSGSVGLARTLYEQMKRQNEAMKL